MLDNILTRRAHVIEPIKKLQCCSFGDFVIFERRKEKVLL